MYTIEQNEASLTQDYGNCRHKWRRNGVRYGKQRLRCVFCRQDVSEDLGKPLRMDIVGALGVAFRDGVGVRAASRLTGYSLPTVTKYYKVFRAFRQAGYSQSAP